jgi:hypothetical protein
MMATRKGEDRQMGGGFAGLAAAVSPDKTLARRPISEVTLVSARTSCCSPMLHEVRSLYLATSSIRWRILRHVRFVQAEVHQADMDVRAALIGGGTPLRSIGPDHLTFVGSESPFDVPGVGEGCGDEEPRDAACSAIASSRLEEGAGIDEGFDGVLHCRRGWRLRRIIGALNDFLRQAVQHIPVDEALTMVNPKHPGLWLPEWRRARQVAERKLRERGVDVIIGARALRRLRGRAGQRNRHPRRDADLTARVFQSRQPSRLVCQKKF